MNDNTIIFTVIYNETEYPINTSRNKYYSLMTLISDHLGIPGFGLCAGMGSCGTCMVEIRQQYSSLRRFELACGVQVNDALANTIIVVSSDRCY